LACASKNLVIVTTAGLYNSDKQALITHVIQGVIDGVAKPATP